MCVAQVILLRCRRFDVVSMWLYVGVNGTGRSGVYEYALSASLPGSGNKREGIRHPPAPSLALKRKKAKKGKDDET